MKYCRMIILSLYSALYTATVAYAGIKELTWHSRANCLSINESITWHHGHSYILNTDSYHYYGTMDANQPKHIMKTGWVNTWRSADVHWTEGTGGWIVSGDHYILDKNRQPQLLGSTIVKDCSIYDGWWDQDPPNHLSTKINDTKIEDEKVIVNDDITLPTRGIHIVPASQIYLSKELREEENAKIKQMKMQGYIEANSNDAVELLKMGQNGYQFTENNGSKYDTDLKKNLSSIKIAFPFKGISSMEPVNIIGFAVAGTWIENKGWSGIAEYFNDKELGTCHFLVNNISLTGGGISLRDDLVKYDINRKPTNINIEGNPHSGFLYSVTWYDNTFIRTLECANKSFDKDITKKLIDFAKTVDNQIH